MEEGKRKGSFRQSALRIALMLVAILYPAWLWTPWEFDIVERKLAEPGHLNEQQVGLLSGKAHVMVVTAHPDDAEYYLGGTLSHLAQLGSDIQLVVCTDGDKGYYPFVDAAKNRSVRRREQTEASRVWHGREPIFLGFPDGRLKVEQDVQDKILAELKRFNPAYVLCFDGDYPPRMSHRDHRRSGINAEKAVRAWGRQVWLMRFSTTSANYFSDISDFWDAKQELLAVHKSQFSGEKLQGVIGAVGAYAEADGEKGGVSLAEGLRCEALDGR